MILHVIRLFLVIVALGCCREAYSQPAEFEKGFCPSEFKQSDCAAVWQKLGDDVIIVVKSPEGLAFANKAIAKGVRIFLAPADGRLQSQISMPKELMPNVLASLDAGCVETFDIESQVVMRASIVADCLKYHHGIRHGFDRIAMPLYIVIYKFTKSWFAFAGIEALGTVIQFLILLAVLIVLSLIRMQNGLSKIILVLFSTLNSFAFYNICADIVITMPYEYNNGVFHYYPVQPGAGYLTVWYMAAIASFILLAMLLIRKRIPSLNSCQIFLKQ